MLLVSLGLVSLASAVSTCFFSDDYLLALVGYFKAVTAKQTYIRVSHPLSHFALCTMLFRPVRYFVT